MKRYFMAFIGVILIGFNVTLLNLSGFGVDTFSCMNMAVSEHLPFSYGVWQIIVNIVIFIGLFIFVIKEKKGISAIFGFGTLWNMIGCGLLVDFFTARYHMFFEDPENLAVKVTFLIVGILGVCLGCSVYMTPELGSAPYDTLGIQIHEKSKIPFKVCRIATDIICVIISLIFGGNVGIGTVIMAFGTGPVVQFLMNMSQNRVCIIKEEENMRLEELLNQYSDRLSENDLYIWDYVEKHKKQCENMTIEELARKCNVSRTTVLRFTKKLSLKGFGEFKVHLKMENDDKKQDTSKAVKVCLAYEEMMRDMVQQDFKEISKLIYQAKRIFVYGTGMVQKIVAKEFKRLFYFTDKRFYDFSGMTEYETVVKYVDSDDLVLIISVSGEADPTIDFAKKVRIKGTPIISITKQKKNPLAEISNYNLYISTTIVEQNMYKGRYESMTSYYILAEMLFLRYLEYLEGRSQSDES